MHIKTHVCFTNWNFRTLVANLGTFVALTLWTFDTGFPQGSKDEQSPSGLNCANNVVIIPHICKNISSFFNHLLIFSSSKAHHTFFNYLHTPSVSLSSASKSCLHSNRDANGHPKSLPKHLNTGDTSWHFVAFDNEKWPKRNDSLWNVQILAMWTRCLWRHHRNLRFPAAAIAASWFEELQRTPRWQQQLQLQESDNDSDESSWKLWPAQGGHLEWAVTNLSSMQ